MAKFKLNKGLIKGAIIAALPLIVFGIFNTGTGWENPTYLNSITPFVGNFLLYILIFTIV